VTSAYLYNLERSQEYLVLMLYIAAPLDQQLGCVEVVVAYRSEQRCLALLVHSLDVCTEL